MKHEERCLTGDERIGVLLCRERPRAPRPPWNRLVGGDRQDDGEGRPESGLRLERERATVAGDHLVREREALAAPLANRLGGEERVEHTGANRLGNAAAGI